jgi:hypothetical protein
MMRSQKFSSALITLVISFSMFSPIPAQATETADQSSLSGDISNGWRVVSSDQRVGASFMSNLSGQFSRLDVRIQKIGSPTNLTASLYAVDGSGFPTGAALVSQAVDITDVALNPSSTVTRVSFATPPSITQGVRYVFILSSTDSGSNAFGVKFTSPSPNNMPEVYAQGSPTNWTVDAARTPLFQTYVTVAPTVSPPTSSGDTPVPVVVIPKPEEAFLGLSPSQISNLSASQLASLDPQAFAALSASQVRAFRPAQVVGLTSEQIRAFLPKSLRAMQPRTLNNFRLKQIRAVSRSQALELRSTQINELSTGKRIAIEMKRR